MRIQGAAGSELLLNLGYVVTLTMTVTTLFWSNYSSESYLALTWFSL